MKISLDWLRDYATLDAPISDLTRALVDTGTEVDRVERQGEGVVVARVVALAPVPESDRGVQFADIELEDGETIRVLTGAQNLQVGHLVPYAPPGTRLPGMAEPLGVRTMFGKYRSPGMLCAADELGVGDDHSGILVLDEGRPGQRVSEVLGLDVVFEVDVTTNRPDCLSHVGIARELAAALGEPLREPGYDVPEAVLSATSGASRISLRIADPAGCPRFTACIIENVSVGPSPQWLQRRLRAIGLRPINNVVDVTNYVLHEIGAPLHAFDLDRFIAVGGGEKPAAVVVRRARDGEKLVCLDEVERTLTAADMVVCSGDVAVSLAGVMGGDSTAVTESTRNVLLEAATWEPTGIRATSRRLALRSDASALFEKGLPDTLPPLALNRAAALIAELAHGHVLREPVDEWPAPLPPVEPVSVTAGWLGDILGYPVDVSEAATALAHLGFQVEQDGETLTVTAPHVRRDVRIREDVAEEVGRALGYDRVPSTLPGRRLPVLHLAADAPPEDRVRDVCIGAGFDEVLPYVFTTPDVAARVAGAGDGRSPLRLRNPISDDWTHLRTSLLPGLAQTLALNVNRGSHGAAVFEVGRVFWEGERQGLPAGSTPDRSDERLTPLPAEPLLLALAAHVAEPGPDAAAAMLRHVQAVVARLAKDLAADETVVEEAELPALRPGRSGRLRLGRRDAGIIGELGTETVEAFDLRGRVVVAEVRLDVLIPVEPRAVRYHPVARFPAVVQDLAVSVPEERRAGEALTAIREAGVVLLEHAELYDEFRGRQVGEGRKGWTFRLTFRSPDRTLTSEEAQECQEAIALALRARCGAEVRK